MRHGELNHIFDILERSFLALNIDFYLIGALARQVWYEKGGLDFSTTRDVDYAVLVGSHEEYRKIKAYLTEKEKFTPHSGNDFVLIAPDGMQVDILPFGAIEQEEGITVHGQALTSISVDGMMEVYSRGTAKVSLDTGHVFKVATLPAIALLKFIAYDDRPEQRQKDVTDITNLMLYFFNLHEELIYEYHNDLFDEQLLPRFERIGPVVLGREMRKIADGNEALTKRLNRIIEQHTASAEKSAFIRLMVQSVPGDYDIAAMCGFLQDIHWGFNNPGNIPVQD